MSSERTVLKASSAVVLLLLMLGCSGSGGTEGPKGDKGDAGVQGQPGVSVVSSDLQPGDSHCPTGGSQFTSATATTFACNGAQGVSGVPGPKGDTGAVGPSGAPGTGALSVVDAGGNVLGALVAIDSPFATVVRWLRDGKWLAANAKSGNWYTAPSVHLYFLNSFCTHNPGEGPFFAAGLDAHPQFVQYDGRTGWSPVGAPEARVPRSYVRTTDHGCESIGPYTMDLVMAVEVPLPSAPTGPLIVRAAP